MNGKESKDFGPIHADYAFFEEHATEAAEDLRAYLPHVQSLASRTQAVGMLDFGCGSGNFTLRFLDTARFPREQLWLYLVEPDESYRRQAVERLQLFTLHPVEAWSRLPPPPKTGLDLVLANHVFYYVPDLDDVVSGILDALAAPGLFLTAIAGQGNTLIQFWNRCFAMMGRPVPFHTAEDLQSTLDRQGVAYTKEAVRYELVFPDSETNRLRILRFLLGEHMQELPRQSMLELFDDHASGGQIVIQPVHEHFVVWR